MRRGASSLPVWLGLLASIALHLLIIVFWRGSLGHAALPAAKTPALLVQLMRLQTPERALPKPLEAKREDQKPPAQRKLDAPSRSDAETIARTVPPPTLSTVIDEKNDAPPVSTSSSTIFNAKRDIAKIDRELRKDFPKLPEAAPNSTQSRLEKGIAAAAKPQATTMEDIVSADGRRMTRVVGPNGTYCVRKEGAGATDGLDMIQGGVRAKTTNCPEFGAF